MSLSIVRTRVHRPCILLEEQRAWASFYQRVGQEPAIAMEVMVQLEAEPELKRVHLALYLRCGESVRRQAAREARNQRIGRWVRWLLDGIFIAAPRTVRRALRQSSEIAVACLPQDGKPPAVAPVPRAKTRSTTSKATAPVSPQVAENKTRTDETTAIRTGT